MIEVLEAGPLVTVQDLGRTGRMRLGIARSGAMDPLALRLGNLLLRNPETSAGIEAAFSRVTVRFSEPIAFAVTGARMRVSLNGGRLPGDFARMADASDVLTLEPEGEGVFAYLTLEGGLDVPARLGSRATDLKSGYGGLDGRALAAGDRLACATAALGAALPRSGLGVARRAWGGSAAGDPVVLRFIPAAEWSDVGPNVRRQFLSQPWTVSREVNRMGYRLSGPALEPLTRRELFSHGIVPGVIQLPPGGQPIVQMVEANTCGGYPKLGVVIAADLPRLAQQRSGRTVRFVEVSRDQALRAGAEVEKRLRLIAAALELRRELSG